MSRRSAMMLALIVLGTCAALLWPDPDTLRGRKTLVFTVWGMPFEDRLFEDVYAREWERLNPSVRVDYRRYGDDLLMKYNAWHTRGRGAEVMRIRITDYHGMVERGMLLPLTPLIESRDGLSATDLADFPEHIMRHLRVGESGALYALPEDNAQFGLFYNRAIFDEHNRAHPEQRVEYPSPDWTWEDLRAAARALTRHGPDGAIMQAGFDFAVWSWPFLTLLAQAGGEEWSADGLTCLIDSDAGVRALEFIRAMQREDRSFEARLGYQSGTGPDALFASGRTAMFLDGSWRVPNFEQTAPNLDFAVAPLPRGPRDGGRPAVVSGSVLWAISAHARYPEEAWKFLRWLVAREQALRYWDTLRVAPPARLSVLASPQFRSTRGVERPRVPGAPIEYDVPPMPPERFADRAAWMLFANTPHPDTGRAPGFVPVHPFQTELEDQVTQVLNEYLKESNQDSARVLLRRAVRNVHAVIDRDRQAKGLPPAARPRDSDATAR